MYKKKNDAKKIAVAAISLCIVVASLSVFTVMVYNGKRNFNDKLLDTIPMGDVTYSDYVSPSNQSLPSETSPSESVSSQDAAGSAESAPNDTSSAATEPVKENFILNPDYKSEFYLVVYKESQTIVAYQKDANGEYTKSFHCMQCSTGAPDTTPTKEGVYRIEQKEKWATLAEKQYGQYGCLISKEENYYISSVPYSKKTAWTMIDGGYENIGKPVSGGGIQLCARDAYWIYFNMPKGTQVNVVNATGPDFKTQSLPKRVKKNGGWDPTDKRANGNPYFD